ncbi:MAG: thiamine pyrophosphate-dependent enzyme [Vicinamibacterales bacterium]
MAEQVLLGDEAVALAAIEAGVTAAYAYPGTPSTEILEYILRWRLRHGRPHAAWTVNEKTAYEEALGVSFAGRRAIVSMKHVGLNVASDPFMNSAIVGINGGLVVAVADDPGMHSSQNEQDSRFYGDFARVVCLEPGDQQQAYDMTREAFDLSERFHIPVMVRLVTRLAHSRAVVRTRAPREENPLSRTEEPASWILLPGNARRQWHKLIERQKEFAAYSETCPHNTLELSGSELGVITSGLARNYFLENAADLRTRPSHLHIGAYPIPMQKVRALCEHVSRVLVLEDGYPYVERQLLGLLAPPIAIEGRESGAVPPDGELTPDLVRAALGLPPQAGMVAEDLALPNRPPQLCAGCPHGDTFTALEKALEGVERRVVTSDIGCYTLGALPPYSAIESCVCMGASVGMAKGASDAGLRPAVAVIGDSTFLHSGLTPLIDAVAAGTDMTLIILDNKAVAMTGGQPTILSSSALLDAVIGTGLDRAHLKVIEAHPRNAERNAEVIRRELEYKGTSVVVAVRECLETIKARKKETEKLETAS